MTEPIPMIRFNRLVMRQDNGCWLWFGTKTHGYGAFSVDGKKRRAHRWYWEQLNGPVPKGFELDHVVCGNRSCVNADHLELVTHQENMRRAVAARSGVGLG